MDKAKVKKALEAAMHALRSYQYGNGSTELAESIADLCSDTLRELDKP